VDRTLEMMVANEKAAQTAATPKTAAPSKGIYQIKRDGALVGY